MSCSTIFTCGNEVGGGGGGGGVGPTEHERVAGSIAGNGQGVLPVERVMQTWTEEWGYPLITVEVSTSDTEACLVKLDARIKVTSCSDFYGLTA